MTTKIKNVTDCLYNTWEIVTKEEWERAIREADERQGKRKHRSNGVRRLRRNCLFLHPEESLELLSSDLAKERKK